MEVYIGMTTQPTLKRTNGLRNVRKTWEKSLAWSSYAQTYSWGQYGINQSNHQ
ncbi:hypothetical protein ACFVR2_11395 [Gottfriedia sp. NPDC057991]|uniref:hypothetical protein n=1 Tax=Gottfriedia sp. NPDC057991 TaxID=3346298 RepID=UPI0036D9F2F7